jgi:glucokinase
VGRLREYVARKVPSVITERYEQHPAAITFRSLIDGVEAGDRVALEVMAAFQRDLGATIVTAVHAYDPEIVVLAGGPMAAADHFLPQVAAYVDRYAFRFPKTRPIPIVRAERSDAAGVLGAVALVMQSASAAALAGDPIARPGGDRP